CSMIVPRAVALPAFSRAHSALLEAECALAFCVVAFSDGKPVPTFPENALIRRTLKTQRRLLPCAAWRLQLRSSQHYLPRRRRRPKTPASSSSATRRPTT